LGYNRENQRKAWTTKLQLLNHKLKSIKNQKAKVRWLQKGDSNSNYFHSIIKWKRQSNAVNGHLVDGMGCGDPGIIKNQVKRYFECRFRDEVSCQVKLDGMQFRHITQQENSELIANLFEDKVKEVVWN